MFTGIIQAVGKVAALQPSGGDLRLRVQAGELPLADVALGDSIATNGVCLTVVELPGDGFWADVSRETIDHTTIAQWRQGQPVNLEKALTPSTPLGGHIVSGHVDGIGHIVERRDDAVGRSLRVAASATITNGHIFAPPLLERGNLLLRRIAGHRRRRNEHARVAAEERDGMIRLDVAAGQLLVLR